MTFIRTIPVAEATGDVQAVYASAGGQAGHVPNYARPFSLRPEVWNAYGPLLRTIRGNLDPRRYELVTVAAAMALGSSYCALVQGQILGDKLLGMEQTEAFARDYRNSGLTDAEKAMVGYVRKIVLRADAIAQDDVDELRRHGFSDTEIFDIAAATAMRCFFSKLIDAVGTQPDQLHAAMEPTLRELLTVGRAIENPGPAT
jgi:uncharacterized peroxidase-related enzyme